MTYPNGTKVSVRNTPNCENGEEGVVVGYYHSAHLLKVDFGGKVVFCGAENCAEIKGMTKYEKIKEVMELVAILTTSVHLAAKHGKDDEEFQTLVKCKTVARQNLESKLRELIQ